MLYYPHFSFHVRRRLLSGLRLIGSNRLEVLSQALAASMFGPFSSPLMPEIIVSKSGDTILIFQAA